MRASGRRKVHAWSTRKTSDSFAKDWAVNKSRLHRPPSQASTEKKLPPSKVSEESLRNRRSWREDGMPAAARSMAWTFTKSSKVWMREAGGMAGEEVSAIGGFTEVYERPKKEEKGFGF